MTREEALTLLVRTIMLECGGGVEFTVKQAERRDSGWWIAEDLYGRWRVEVSIGPRSGELPQIHRYSRADYTAVDTLTRV